MRATCLLTALVVLIVTLGTPAAVLCQAGGAQPTAQVRNSSCCHAGTCGCHGECCVKAAVPDGGPPAVLAPGLSSALTLLALAPVAVAHVTTEAAPAWTDATTEAPLAALPAHASCLTNRAPPLS